MDKKALNILFSTYWSSTGWKPERDQVTPAEDLLYAKRAGVMFDPVRLSHEGSVRRATEVRGGGGPGPPRARARGPPGGRGAVRSRAARQRGDRAACDGGAGQGRSRGRRRRVP